MDGARHADGQWPRAAPVVPVVVSGAGVFSVGLLQRYPVYLYLLHYVSIQRANYLDAGAA